MVQAVCWVSPDKLMCQCNRAPPLTKAPAICKDFELFLCPVAPPPNTMQKVKRRRGGGGGVVETTTGNKQGTERRRRKKKEVRYWRGVIWNYSGGGSCRAAEGEKNTEKDTVTERQRRKKEGGDSLYVFSHQAKLL